MSLILNQSPKTFKEFYGRNIEQMPKLIAEGRVPMSVNQLMQRRIDVRNFNDNLKSFWMDNYFDTGDAVVYHSDGRLKIVLDSQYLREMTPKTQRNGGALILTNEQYNSMDGEEFKKGKFGEVDKPIKKKYVKDHPVWKFLARDQNLLNDYVDYIFAEREKRFGDDDAMGVYSSYPTEGNTPEILMRSWSIYRLEIRSSVVGGDCLDFVIGRLVGIAPEAQSAKISGVENARIYTMTDVQNAVSELEALEGVVRPESLEKVRSLVSKL